jgi:methylglyoxal synthase
VCGGWWTGDLAFIFIVDPSTPMPHDVEMTRLAIV